MELDIDKYIAEKEASYRAIFERQKALGGDQDVDKRLKTALSHYTKQVPWLKKFNGYIPKHWENWQKINDDLVVAGDLKLYIPQRLTDAAACHPHWYIRRVAGENLILSPSQLALILIAPQPGLDYKEIIQFQVGNNPNKTGNQIFKRAKEIRDAWKIGSLSSSVTARLEAHFVPEYLQEYKGGEI